MQHWWNLEHIAVGYSCRHNMDYFLKIIIYHFYHPMDKHFINSTTSHSFNDNSEPGIWWFGSIDGFCSAGCAITVSHIQIKKYINRSIFKFVLHGRRCNILKRIFFKYLFFKIFLNKKRKKKTGKITYLTKFNYLNKKKK